MQVLISDAGPHLSFVEVVRVGDTTRNHLRKVTFSATSITDPASGEVERKLDLFLTRNELMALIESLKTGL